MSAKISFVGLTPKKRPSQEVRVAFKANTYMNLSQRQIKRVRELNKEIDKLVKEQKMLIKKGWKK